MIGEEVAETLVLLLSSVVKYAVSREGSDERQAALMTLAEDSKAALDREKFPGQ